MKKCKLKGWKDMSAVPKGNGKYIIYLGKDKYSKPVTRKQAKNSLGLIIPKGCKK